MTISMMLSLAIIILTISCLGMLIVFRQFFNKLARALHEQAQVIEYVNRSLKESLHNLSQKQTILQGQLIKTTIDSKVASKMSQRGFDLANESVLRVGALEKSTHRVHMVPVDEVVKRNHQVIKKANKVLNPSNEINDWLENGILGDYLNEDQDDG